MRATKQYKLIRKLLQINPRITVGEAAARLKIMEEFCNDR